MSGVSTLAKRLKQLQESGLYTTLSQLQHGIEKEGLRVADSGGIAQTGHPKGLGSALTNGRITTDYSEALLEFITPVFSSVEESLHYLKELHHFSYEQLDKETIWLSSMPPHMKSEEDVPIARYGDSNVGQMKYIYRVGLANRYGKAMQTIAGIHYNFSMPDTFWQAYQELLGDKQSLQDFRSSQYFALIRNFRRYSWLLIYLFGASPALNRSFMNGREIDELEALGDDTLIGPYATSLRMSDLGYSNDAQSSLNVCYNQLQTYANTLTSAISESYPAYEKIGVKVDGEYRQLNASLLQIENEYYSDIRPKRVTLSGEKPVAALKDRGVEYVEVRNVDINPFIPVGIDSAQARFIDSFLVYCLLAPSPEIDSEDCERIKRNHRAIVWQGRLPGLSLEKPEGSVDMKHWAESLLAEIEGVAELLDAGQSRECHLKSINEQREKLANAELTPSAQVLAALRQGLSHDEFVLRQSQQHQQSLMAEGLGEAMRDELTQLAKNSCLQQQEIEAGDTVGFDQYLARYLAQ